MYMNTTQANNLIFKKMTHSLEWKMHYAFDWDLDMKCGFSLFLGRWRCLENTNLTIFIGWNKDDRKSAMIALNSIHSSDHCYKPYLVIWKNLWWVSLAGRHYFILDVVFIGQFFCNKFYCSRPVTQVSHSEKKVLKIPGFVQMSQVPLHSTPFTAFSKILQTRTFQLLVKYSSFKFVQYGCVPWFQTHLLSLSLDMTWH